MTCLALRCPALPTQPACPAALSCTQAARSYLPQAGLLLLLVARSLLMLRRGRAGVGVCDGA